MPDTISLPLAFLFFQGMMFPLLKVTQEKSGDKFIFGLFFISWSCAQYLIAQGLACRFFTGIFELKEWIILAVGLTFLSIGLLFKRYHDDFLDKVGKLLAS